MKRSYFSSSDRGAFNLEGRSGSVRDRNMQVGLFPFDAFEFDSVELEDEPKLKLRNPWKFIASKLEVLSEFFTGKISAPAADSDIVYTVTGTGTHEFVGDANFTGGLTIDGWTPVAGELYVGPTGEKGEKGDKGDQGDEGPRGGTGLHGPSLYINAIGLQSQRSVYDDENVYFLYFATDTQLLYQKMSLATGDWSPGIGYGVPSPILDTSMISTANSVGHSPSFIQGRNYLSVGPIDVEDGVTVDIPNDTVWVVV